ncbi:MAG: hypothetical protein AAFQ82_03480 [Myxococcota bacterium]
MTLALLVALTLCASSSDAKEARRQKLRQQVLNEMRSSPLRKATHWPTLGERQTPKLVPAGADVIRYVLIDNVLNGFPERPRPSGDPTMQRDLVEAWSTLPPRVRELAETRVPAIFLVEDLGGSAYTETIKNKAGVSVGAFLVVDAKAMARPSNEWMSWKENTPFAPGPLKLRARISGDESTERVSSVRYLLLHELGHVLGETAGAHPPWGPAGDVGEIDLKDFPFLQLGWVEQEVGLSTRFERGRPGAFRYYQPEERRMKNGTMAPSYRWLQGTSFATLYSLNSIFDDFAEAFANYVHVVMLDAPYGIEISDESGSVLVRYRSCWDEPRCAAKRAFLESFLAPKALPAARPVKLQ